MRQLARFIDVRRWTLLALLICWAIAPAFAQNPGPSGLEEVLSVGGPDGDKLLMWVGLAVDEDGSLFVTDAMDYSIKVFDARGRLMRKTGRPGAGPGEFQALRELALSRSLVFVTDQNLPRISVFDKELRFLYAIPISRPVQCLRALPDGTIAASFSPIKKGEYSTIWLADSKGQTLVEIPHGTDPSQAAADRASMTFAGPEIVLAYNFRDRVLRMDKRGRTLWVRDLFHFPDAKMKSILGFKLPSQFIYKDIAVDRAGRIYVLGGSMSKHPSADIYVLDSGGRLITTLVLPDASHCLALDSQGYLYSRANEGVTIKKYRVRLPAGTGAAPAGRNEP